MLRWLVNTSPRAGKGRAVAVTCGQLATRSVHVCVCVFEEGEGETEQLWAWEAGSALMRNVSSLLSFCLLFPSIFSLGGGCKCPYNRRSCNH